MSIRSKFFDLRSQVIKSIKQKVKAIDRNVTVHQDVAIDYSIDIVDTYPMSFKVWGIFAGGVKGYLYNDVTEVNKYVPYDTLRIEVLIDVNEYLDGALDWVNSGGNRDKIAIRPAPTTNFKKH